MGTGIAQVAVQSDFDVIVFDVNNQVLSKSNTAEIPLAREASGQTRTGSADFFRSDSSVFVLNKIN